MKKEKHTYAVCHEPQDREGRVFACYAVAAVCAMLALAALSADARMQRIDTHVTLGTLAATGALCVYLARRPARPAPRIVVRGDVFRVEKGSGEGTEYSFSQITRVSLHFPLTPNGRGGVRQGKPVWRIFVGKKSVASFSMEMKHANRLLAKLDSLGLITPLGTGMKPEERR